MFQRVGQCEYELTELGEESDLEGGSSIQVLALVDLDAIVTYGLKVSWILTTHYVCKMLLNSGLIVCVRPHSMCMFPFSQKQARSISLYQHSTSMQMVPTVSPLCSDSSMFGAITGCLSQLHVFFLLLHGISR